MVKIDGKQLGAQDMVPRTFHVVGFGHESSVKLKEVIHFVKACVAEQHDPKGKHHTEPKISL